MTRNTNWQTFGMYAETYFEAVEFGLWDEAATAAKLAALSCPALPMVREWLDRSSAAKEKAQPAWRQLLSVLSLRRETR